ncbi:hypothetical protein [Sphaerimonospora thailandensis]|uniref:Uncharacterized protein n=1 Tax=Sphaerimonospora thailandensis TaxID=795644 RepID=A0A8J3W053_9ACTN|nr:hypothetical protein [Sphaerimonospora thailandensis]GIH71884.1 hypothetical protein Mth01_41370 [Sphaerimonospora thailandensis]
MNDSMSTRDSLALAELVELQDVSAVAFSGQRLKPGRGSNLQLSVAAGFALTEQALSYKFDLDGSLVDVDENDPLVQLSLSLVVTYVPRNANAENWVGGDHERLKAFGDSFAWPAAYPFVREGVTAILSRLGADAYQLPMLRPSDLL